MRKIKHHESTWNYSHHRWNINVYLSKITFSHKEKVADVGPVEINKNENHTVDWPTYAAGVAVVAGIVVLLIDRRKT